jgi:hypothetical protein
MTYETRDGAMVAVLLMQRRLKTGGWKIRVHENLGWHCELKRGGLTLWESSKTGRRSTYSCLLGVPPGDMGGHGFWVDRKRHYDPNKAVESQLQVAQAFVRQCQAEIRAALDPRDWTHR